MFGFFFVLRLVFFGHFWQNLVIWGQFWPILAFFFLYFSQSPDVFDLLLLPLFLCTVFIEICRLAPACEVALNPDVFGKIHTLVAPLFGRPPRCCQVHCRRWSLDKTQVWRAKCAPDSLETCLFDHICKENWQIWVWNLGVKMRKITPSCKLPVSYPMGGGCTISFSSMCDRESLDNFLFRML